MSSAPITTTATGSTTPKTIPDTYGPSRSGPVRVATGSSLPELSISVETVETHVSAVLRTPQLSSRHELTR